MDRKYESHITCRRDQMELVKEHSNLLEMSFSVIEGDPVMLDKSYCYLSAYDTDSERLLAKVKKATSLLQQAGVDVLREKVEEILYDSKTNYNILT